MSSGMLVVALHCSGGGAAQWRSLQAALAHECIVVTPEHYGSERAGPWTGEHAFSLADEARRTVDTIDACTEPVHLVGHSYGGAVALQIALERPGRVASLSLYEPCVFHVLREEGEAGERALDDLRSVAATMVQGVLDGAYQSSAESFVNYWGGEGTWTALRPAARASVLRWVTKAPLEFRATIESSLDARAYDAVTAPVLIMRGQHAPACTRLMAEALARSMRRVRFEVIAGAGHMGPLTHPQAVNDAIARHIAGADAGASAERSVARASGRGELVATT